MPDSVEDMPVPVDRGRFQRWWAKCQAANRRFTRSLRNLGIDAHGFFLDPDDPQWQAFQEAAKRLRSELLSAEKALPRLVPSPSWWQGELRLKMRSLSDLAQWVRHVLDRIQIAYHFYPPANGDPHRDEALRLAHTTVRNYLHYCAEHQMKPIELLQDFGGGAAAEEQLRKILDHLAWGEGRVAGMGPETLPQAQRNAYFLYGFAEQLEGRRLTDQEAYDIIKEIAAEERGTPEEMEAVAKVEMPGFPAWQKALSRARNKLGDKKYHPRSGRRPRR